MTAWTRACALSLLPLAYAHRATGGAVDVNGNRRPESQQNVTLLHPDSACRPAVGGEEETRRRGEGAGKVGQEESADNGIAYHRLPCIPISHRLQSLTDNPFCLLLQTSHEMMRLAIPLIARTHTQVGDSGNSRQSNITTYRLLYFVQNCNNSSSPAFYNRHNTATPCLSRYKVCVQAISPARGFSNEI